LHKRGRKIQLTALVLLMLATVFGLVVFINAESVQAAFNEKINYQGKLTNSSGVVVANGNKCMKFRLMDALTSGNELWNEEWKASSSYVVTSGGLFSVLLGTHTSLSSVNFNTSSIYLEVQYDAACDGTYEEIFDPRKPLGAVPAAMEAKKLDGGTWATPGTIGLTTANTGAFTTLSASNGVTVSGGNVSITTDSGQLVLGSSGDVNLYRNAAGTLRTGNTLIVDGNVGIGTTSTDYKLDIVSTTNQLGIRYDATNYTTFAVDSGGDLSIVPTGSDIKITGAFRVEGTSGSSNYLATDQSTAEPSLGGTARHTRKQTYSAEYAGATLTKFYGAGTDTSTTGAMIADVDTTLNGYMNYYQWDSTQSAVNYYTVAVKVTLPEDFSDWTTSNALTIGYQTESATASNCAVDAYVYLTSNTGSAVVSGSGYASTSWATISFSKANLDNSSAPDWNATDKSAIIFLRLASKTDGSSGSYYARIGDITLNYLSKW